MWFSTDSVRVSPGVSWFSRWVSTQFTVMMRAVSLGSSTRVKRGGGGREIREQWLLIFALMG